MHFLAWSFAAAWGILVAQMIWVCEQKATWKVKHFVISNARLSRGSNHRRHLHLSVQLGFQLLSLNSSVRFLCVHNFFIFSLGIVGDILADSILIVAPLRLLWHLDSKSCPQRRRLLVVFSSSIVTTTTSLIHAYCLLRVGGIFTLLAGFIEVRHTFLHVHP